MSTHEIDLRADLEDDSAVGPDEAAAERAEFAAAASDIVGSMSTEEQLQRLAARACRLAHADYAAVATIEPDGRTFWRATAGTRTDAWRSVVFPGHSGTAGRVVAANAPVVITGFPDNPDFPVAEFPAHAAEGMRTAFAVPLRSGGQPFGAVIAAWRRDVPVDPPSVARVQTLADLAALALTRASLLEQAEDRARELAAANRQLMESRNELARQAAEAQRLNGELQRRNADLDARVAELDAVLDQMADGVLIVDRDGHVVRFNPALQTMYGRPLAGLTAERWVDTLRIRRVTGEAMSADELPTLRALREERVTELAEWMAERPDGSVVRLLGSAAPLREADGRLVGAVLVARDITERAKLLEELQRATRLKERFFAQMSHELRTPINAILGYSGLIAEGLAGELPPAATAMVTRVQRSARHLLELVNDVLDISRLEAGKVSVTPERFDLVALAHDTMTSVEPQAGEKGLTLEVRAPARLMVRSDPARVRQILLNLVSNAVKFTERGSVTIDVAWPEAERVSLTVADTGIGIAADKLEHVFAEFVQVGGSQGGTGLGLTISRRLARLLCGNLSVTSEVGVGSRFTLTLPVDIDQGPGSGSD